MKTAHILIAFLVSYSVQAQDLAKPDTGIVQTEYTRLDYIKKGTRNFFSGEAEELSFALVELKNLQEGETIYGVEVNIRRRDNVATGGSLALGNLGRLWGGAASITYQQINEAGYIFLSADELGLVMAFLQKIIGATGQTQEQMKVFRMRMGTHFEIGMVYDPDYSPSSYETEGRYAALAHWRYLFSVDDVAYTLPYVDGIEVIQRLSHYQKQVQELMQ